MLAALAERGEGMKESSTAGGECIDQRNVTAGSTKGPIHRRV